MGDWSFFFFQAEDGIRDWSVTGVQTCALPISMAGIPLFNGFLSKEMMLEEASHTDWFNSAYAVQIGRASCRERV